jgi:hypothetical protein
VHGKVDDHADVRHARRKRADPGDRDRQDIFARDRLLDGGDGGVEALDMADHQRHPGAPGGGDDVPSLLHRGGDRLFDQDVNVARDAGERDLVMKVRRRRDGHRVHTFGDQFVESCEGAAARQFRGARPMRRQRIDHPDQCRIRQAGQHPGMVAAHDAGANDADAKRTFRVGFNVRCGPFGIHIVSLGHPTTTASRWFS